MQTRKRWKASAAARISLLQVNARSITTPSTLLCPMLQRDNDCAGFPSVVQHGTQSMLPKIITTGFRAVHLIYFFTAGDDEVSRGLERDAVTQILAI